MKFPESKKSWAIGTVQDRQYWEEKFEIAKKFMEERSNIPAVLIEVAAQHPLLDGEKPNEEFTKRLLLAKTLYKQESNAGKHVEIYVPGSRHRHEGVVDKVSLSEAGMIFLEQQGISREIIHGDDLNFKYKGDRGVYNSADECFVASSYFKDGNFGYLFSVLSPIQVFRKTIHYIEFGVLPLNYTAPALDTFHDYIDEMFEAVPYALFVDPDMQSKNSVRANELRHLRMP
ncbi:hypothetical protein I8751_09890 [Nostocaceae cyanobacterium CENA357]|uniref:Uncharacterized protein n=1 Tax=Atlanticothrix silvestris CENA357 TaxID=1725252 RepID=A0A8J7HHV7_9CYAN|nr:hypothetical protein [Atlanticothrix silvestris]MBH8552678.1 hypothetical protein [Atlanticothrix silvestris CENA357]